MKIRIKSREEIEKTLLGKNHCNNPSCYFASEMFNFCDKIFNSEPSMDASFSVKTPAQDGMKYDWHWHPDWYEVVEDFTEEDLMDIELMDEMLGYFLSSRND